MIRFSDIATDSLFGRTSRKCLSMIPKNWIVPVLQGPLKGMRWIVGAQNHGMWLGSYEVEKQQAITKMLQRGQTFYDIGANVGFYTLLGARHVGSSGRVVAVEPLPRNIEFLEKHLAINNILNVKVVKKAISDFHGAAPFSDEGHSTSRLAEEGILSVMVTTFDQLVEEIGAPPDLVKVDVEGAEAGLLRGAKNVMEKYRPMFFMAVHSEEIFVALIKLCHGARYAVKTLDGTEIKHAEFRAEVLLLPTESADCVMN